MTNDPFNHMEHSLIDRSIDVHVENSKVFCWNDYGLSCHVHMAFDFNLEGAIEETFNQRPQQLARVGHVVEYLHVDQLKQLNQLFNKVTR